MHANVRDTAPRKLKWLDSFCQATLCASSSFNKSKPVMVSTSWSSVFNFGPVAEKWELWTTILNNLNNFQLHNSVHPQFHTISQHQIFQEHVNYNRPAPQQFYRPPASAVGTKLCLWSLESSLGRFRPTNLVMLQVTRLDATWCNIPTSPGPSWCHLADSMAWAFFLPTLGNPGLGQQLLQ